MGDDIGWEVKKERIWVVKLIHYKLTVIAVEPKESYEKVFSTKDKAEMWLISNGFVYGESHWFVETGKPYWFHQKDYPEDHVKVELYETFTDNYDTVEWVERLNYRHRFI